jgi:hypothetical protein
LPITFANSELTARDAAKAKRTSRAALAAAGSRHDLMAVVSAIADVGLLDARGAETTLQAEIVGRRAVIVLYRGAWCPDCNLTLRT